MKSHHPYLPPTGQRLEVAVLVQKRWPSLKRVLQVPLLMNLGSQTTENLKCIYYDWILGNDSDM